MEFQKQEIGKELSRHGWQIATIEVLLSDWWLDEVWTLESTWSKLGTNAFICFLIDPMIADSNRKKGEHVWAVSASREMPGNRLNADDECLVVFNKKWKKELQALLGYLNKIRQ